MIRFIIDFILKGDSGGGLVLYKEYYKSRAVLLGVSSGQRPSGDCSGAQINYFTPIAPNIDWIVKTIRDNS